MGKQATQDRRRAAYENGLRCWDRNVADLANVFLGSKGAVHILITADHSEMMGENGLWGHSQPELRVALAPGAAAHQPAAIGHCAKVPRALSAELVSAFATRGEGAGPRRLGARHATTPLLPQHDDAVRPLGIFRGRDAGTGQIQSPPVLARGAEAKRDNRSTLPELAPRMAAQTVSQSREIPALRPGGSDPCSVRPPWPRSASGCRPR